MAKRLRVLCAAAAVLPLALLAACSSGSSGNSPSSSASAPGAAANGKTITETGSTLLFPLFGAWQTDYNTAFPDVTITSDEPGVLTVIGATSVQVGELAAANRLVLHELTPVSGSLEEAYMSLTQDSVEYHSSEVPTELTQEVAR